MDAAASTARPSTRDVWYRRRENSQAAQCRAGQALFSLAEVFHVFRVDGESLGQPFHTPGEIACQVVAGLDVARGALVQLVLDTLPNDLRYE